MIKIGYAGILQHFTKTEKNWKTNLKNLIWTFRPNSIDPSYRSPLALFRALVFLKENHGIHADHIQFHLWGNIDPFFKACAQNMGLNESVIISGYRSHQETITSLNQMDILFLPLEKSNSEHHRNLFVPSKLFEYISIGKPILAICEPSETQEILLSSGLGIHHTPENENELINNLHQLILDPTLLKNYKRNDEILQQFSAKTATEKLANILNQF
jgi:hypothetical protein